MPGSKAKSSGKVLTLPLTISDLNFEEDAKKILEHIRPNWKGTEINFEVFTDGITNKLMGCHAGNDRNDVVLVRINGIGSDIIINRDEEQLTFQCLSEANCAPPIYCVFDNGMAYGYFPGKTLDKQTVREPNIQKLIAEELVRLHSVRGPGGPVPSQFNHRVLTWLDAVPTHFKDPSIQEVFEKKIPTHQDLKTELKEITKALDALDMKSVFSHNDLLLKNIIYDDREGKIHFIDYEYAFYNYEAFDIGDHFAEYAGMVDVDYDLYPRKDEQLPWLRHYLETKAAREGRSPDSVQDRDVEILYIQTNKCACAAHFLWGVWSLIQAQHSIIDFDYVGYASTRFKEYFRRKEEFFTLDIGHI
ncbi:unnamed protein product [Lymnaea stagnalis]|uniref:ethanolamine kinase n=1 Tax=Lymnaea stagnalis TaxID=6523 RepID=A0AAV2I5V1_LYMST